MPDPSDVMRDKTQLRENLYADPGKLGARVYLHARFNTNLVPISAWELDLVDLSGVRCALDAGCGIGVFLLPLARHLAPHGGRVVGLDLAEGTLGQARARAEAEGLPVECVIGDVEALPFADASFDLVLANYMLYHVPNLDRAIGELRRVLRPGGTMLAATNGEGSLREMWQMLGQALARMGAPTSALAQWRQRTSESRGLSFRLENGVEWLGRHFADVRLERYPGELRVSEVEPLVAYLASLWTLDQITQVLAPSAHEQAALRARLLDSFREVVAERIAAEGVVHIHQDTGAFVAR